VIKADGLAAGKGVTVAMTRAEAEAALHDIFSGRFGGAEAVIEEFLEGEEVSFFALTDGSTIVPFGSAQDHKRVGEGDTGPNTGGMGAYSPARVLTPELEGEVLSRIIAPTVKALADEGMPYSGVLFAGLMLTPTGPQLIEYNARFGDPECQVLMMRLESDLAELLLACAENRLAACEPPKTRRKHLAQKSSTPEPPGRTARSPPLAAAS
jgi:phosphoribosylamine--glycine ligase